MKRTMMTSGLVVAALALGAFAMSTLPAEAGRARSGVRIGPFPTSGAHASVGGASATEAWSGTRFAPSPTASSAPGPKPVTATASAPGAAPGTAPGCVTPGSGATPSPASLTDTVSFTV